MMELYKYHGAGNDFLLYDARTAPEAFPAERIAALCDRHTGIGSDGLMVLSEAPGYDFRMEFFNPDGSGGMMCGNGGRCIVAFARDRGIAPAADGSYHFLAPDGPHTAWLLSDDGPVKTVRLGMKDVTEYRTVSLAAGESGAAAGGSHTPVIPSATTVISDLIRNLSGWFLDTGTRHFVLFVDKVSEVDVEGLGRTIRHLPEFGPVGVNVNFVEVIGPDEIAVRTFEKGVEAETLACGTGITASAIAAWLDSCRPASCPLSSEVCLPRQTTLVHARRHDLTVSFTPSRITREAPFINITLTGPAEHVAKVLLP